MRIGDLAAATGTPVETIRTALRDAPGGDCGAVNALLDEHLQHVGERVRELKRLQQDR